MATVINNPTPAQESSSTGFLLGIILLIIFALLLFFYGVPYLQKSVSGPQITVPEKIDVNVNSPSK